ncbi:hypothetical protein M138_4772 [Bacteroides fragilis str. S23L17]|nr:hypothetical protein M138_4772 [Bacteroides fragilis str. S23L17]
MVGGGSGIEACGLLGGGKGVGQLCQYIVLLMPHAAGGKGGYLLVHLAGGTLRVCHHHKGLLLLAYPQVCRPFGGGGGLAGGHEVIEFLAIVIPIHLEGKDVEVVHLTFGGGIHSAGLAAVGGGHLQVEGHFRLSCHTSAAGVHLARKLGGARGGCPHSAQHQGGGAEAAQCM